MNARKIRHTSSIHDDFVTYSQQHECSPQDHLQMQSESVSSHLNLAEKHSSMRYTTFRSSLASYHFLIESCNPKTPDSGLASSESLPYHNRIVDIPLVAIPKALLITVLLFEDVKISAGMDSCHLLIDLIPAEQPTLPECMTSRHLSDHSHA